MGGDEVKRLEDALLRMKLIEQGEPVRWSGLTGGVSSLIAVAGTVRGSICVKAALSRLKVAADWRAPIERNEAEVGWIRQVMEIAPAAVPRVLGHDAQSQAFAMEYLSPEAFRNWKAQLFDGDADPRTAAQVARILANIHAATAHDTRLAGIFDNAGTFLAIRLDPYFGAAAQRHPDCAPVLQRLIDQTDATRIALIHGDVSPKNLMIGPNGPIFIDAECATYGDPAFDLSFCLNHLLLKQVCLPTLRPRLAACFSTLAGTYIQKVTWEPPAAFEQRATMLLLGLLLARVDGKSPVEYLDQAGQDFVRRFARAHLLPSAPPLRGLMDLASAWEDALGS